MSASDYREGSLEAPTRNTVPWRKPEYYEEQSLNNELERVFDICHTCRRCVSLCNAFPTLFDLIDDSETLEVDGVAKGDYKKVIDQCYLCDLCYMTKCPYVPPHEWNVDFPHLMLRGKAVSFSQKGVPVRDRILSSTDTVGKFASIPVISQAVNKANKTGTVRKAMESLIGISAEAPLPEFTSNTFRKRIAKSVESPHSETDEKVGLFVTCYGNRNAPSDVESLVEVLEHNNVEVSVLEAKHCCGMPKFELGDLETLEMLKDKNISLMAEFAASGHKIMAPVPSCVLMFRQELPLLFPEDEAVSSVASAMIDPFEFMMSRHKKNKLKTDFRNSLGKVAYHAPCHQRVQNIGPKTREVLELIPDTEVISIERCSGHDGTYAVKKENYAFAKKICRPVVSRIKQQDFDYFVSDCPMAGDLIASGVDEGKGEYAHTVFSLLRYAYGI